MFFGHTTGVSSKSPGAALAEALKAGLSSSSDAVSVHLIVQRVIKVGDNWKAVVDVVTEPRIEPEQKVEPLKKEDGALKPVLKKDEEEGEREKHEQREKTLKRKRNEEIEAHKDVRPRKKREILQPALKPKERASEYIPEPDEEPENRKRKEKELEHRHEQELQAEIEYREEDEYREHHLDEILTHLYLEIVYEDLFYNTIMHQFDFSHVHIVAEGSLWSEVNRHHPDMELYEAAHAGYGTKKLDAPKLGHRPSRSHRLAEELVND